MPIVEKLQLEVPARTNLRRPTKTQALVIPTITTE
jgi:hypothetical protein